MEGTIIKLKTCTRTFKKIGNADTFLKHLLCDRLYAHWSPQTTEEKKKTKKQNQLSSNTNGVHLPYSLHFITHVPQILVHLFPGHHLDTSNSGIQCLIQEVVISLLHVLASISAYVCALWDLRMCFLFCFHQHVCLKKKGKNNELRISYENFKKAVWETGNVYCYIYHF